MKDVELISIEVSSEANTTTPVCKVSLQVMVSALRMRKSYHLGSGSYEIVMDSCSSCQRPRTHVTQNHRARLSLKL